MLLFHISLYVAIATCKIKYFHRGSEHDSEKTEIPLQIQIFHILYIIPLPFALRTITWSQRHLGHCEFENNSSHQTLTPTVYITLQCTLQIHSMRSALLRYVLFKHHTQNAPIYWPTSPHYLHIADLHSHFWYLKYRTRLQNQLH